MSSSSTKLKKSELKVPTGLRKAVKATPSTPAAAAGGASSSTPEGTTDGEVKAARVVKPLSKKKLQKYQAEHENRGVCYLSRIPPYLKPSALREMLSGLGTDVLRVYLAAQQRGHTALARSGPRDRPPLQRPTRLLRAAIRPERRARTAWMPRRGCGRRGCGRRAEGWAAGALSAAGPTAARPTACEPADGSAPGAILTRCGCTCSSTV